MRCRSIVHTSTLSLSLLALVAGVACKNLTGNDTDTDSFDTEPQATSFGTDFGTDSFGTDGSSGGASTTVSTTTPTTTTSASTTTASTSADTGSTETGDTDPTGADFCIGSGSFLVRLLDRTDLYNHFPFLKLFYDPAAPDETTEETFDFIIGADGSITIDVQPRASGSGEGHAGLLGISGTITESCDVDFVTAADFASDTGPFGTVDVTVTGLLPPFDPNALPLLTLTLEGGGIPNGPITYSLEIVSQN